MKNGDWKILGVLVSILLLLITMGGIFLKTGVIVEKVENQSIGMKEINRKLDNHVHTISEDIKSVNEEIKSIDRRLLVLETKANKN